MFRNLSNLPASGPYTRYSVRLTLSVSNSFALVSPHTSAAWKAPTPDHEGLRKFMCEQIEQSIDFDCGGDYGNTPTLRLTGEAWAAAERTRYLRDVQYHEKERAGEVSRAATRTEWVRALRAAL